LPWRVAGLFLLWHPLNASVRRAFGVEKLLARLLAITILLLPSISHATASTEKKRNERNSSTVDGETDPQSVRDDHSREATVIPNKVVLGSSLGCLVGGTISAVSFLVNPFLTLVSFSLLASVGAAIGAIIGAALSNADVVGASVPAIPGILVALLAPAAYIAYLYYSYVNFPFSVANINPVPAFLVAAILFHLGAGPLTVLLVALFPPESVSGV
jgi:hypothetical protein